VGLESQEGLEKGGCRRIENAAEGLIVIALVVVIVFDFFFSGGMELAITRPTERG
jgi:hypothetical protein